MQLKIRILLAAFILLFLGLILRLFYWQIVKGNELSGQAKRQYKSTLVTQAPRGNIIASDGTFWAMRNQTFSVYANSKEIVDPPKKLADKFAPFFPDEAAGLEGLLSKNSTHIVIAPRVNPDIKKSIEALGLKGIGFDEEETRFYPEASSSAQLMGFVGKDVNGADTGYFGLEGYYNLPLEGKSGFVGQEKDAKGSPILIDESRLISAIGGVDLVTSVDKRIQLLAEDKLKEGIEKYGAASGSISIIEPKTGHILAMASEPSFDPGEYWNYGDVYFKNPVISNTFEPGSIFKVLVMAAGLDAGVVKPDTQCGICAGPLRIDKYLIKTWNNEYQAGISMTDVIVHSDNVGMSFVGQSLGKDALHDYLDKFGIGKLTGIDLQGEAASSMRKRGTWSDVDLATTSFGQGIAVTGIQMLRAVSAIANGGYLVSPRVVTSIKGDGWEEKVRQEAPVRIISESAAKQTAQMMVEAVNRGEAKWTKLRGFDNVAGKTGTAQIPVEGHYDQNNTNHSFIGFAPVDNPKFVMLVTLQSPQSSPWAAETAAPLWFNVARDLFPYLGVIPSE